MNILKALWRGFLLLWTTLCAIFLFGVVRTYIAQSLGFPFLGIALTLGMWVGGICLVWGVSKLAGRFLAKRS
ncbi:hypothetical protein JCM15519_20220 [Fundidesulfovibrio butyratiphilus]